MPKTLTKAEAVQILEEARIKFDTADTREDLMETLRQAGRKVGYTPAFRCLVMNLQPSESVRWD
jgi:hypothetical protein